MSAKRSPESRVIDYFQDTPLPLAQAILGIVKANVKRRADANPQSVPAKPKQARKRRTAKALAETETSTAVV